MNLENTYKGFIIPGLSWYKSSVQRKSPHIIVGIYSKEGGTCGEFNIIWDGIGIKLDAYNDSWAALCHMPELIQLMNHISENNLEPTLEEFADMLRGLYYVDCTEYDAETNILVKAYIIPSEEYDAHKYVNPTINVGLYDTNASEFVGYVTFTFVDDNIKFETCGCSWSVMCKLSSDIRSLMQNISAKNGKVSLAEFVKSLDELGYSDRTNRPY